MSGAEVIGLASGIIAIVDAIIQIHNAVQDASGVPSTFRNAASWMPLLKDTMLAIQNDLNGKVVGEASVVALQRVLEGCNDKVQALEKIFETIKVAPDASGFKRYVVAGRALGKSRRLDELTQGIQLDLQLLAANYTINASARTNISRKLEEDPVAETQKPPSQSDSTIANYGSGSQHVHTGTGNQNINTGSGGQFSGTFTGPFNFNASTGE